MNGDKMNSWSEGHGYSEDMTHGLDDLDPPVGVHVVKRGVIPLTDCTYCGRQWKGIFPWAEVAQFYVLPPEKIQHVIPSTKATRNGVMCALRCNGCSKDFSMLVDWDDIRKWVDVGIRSGCLDPRIKQARQQQ